MTKAASSLLVAVVLAGAGMRAQELPPEVHSSFVAQTWRVEDGLPGGTVADLVQDQDGYLWLATFGGLARFDGLRFEVYDLSTTPELQSIRLVEIDVDRSGNLWIGTLADGMVRRDRDGTFRHFAGGAGAPHGATWAVEQTADGSVWVGGDGLYRHAPDGTWECLDASLDGREVRAMQATPDGRLWVGTTRGLARWVDGELREEEGAGDLGIVTSLSLDLEGALWAFSSRGCHVIEADGTHHRHERSMTLPISSLVTRDSVVAVDTVGIQEFRFEDVDGSREIRVEYEERSAVGFRALAWTRDGDLMCGTNFGLMRMSNCARLFRGVKSVVGLADTEGAGKRDGAWALRDDGLVQLGQSEGSRVNLSPSIELVTVDVAGRIWWVDDGLHMRFPNGGMVSYELPPGWVRTLFPSRDGSMWVSCDGVVLRIFDDRREEIALPETVNRLRSFAQGPDGTVWAADDARLVEFSEDGVVCRDVSDGLPPGEIRGLHVDADGGVWVSSYGGGLARFRSGRAVRFGRAQGLPEVSLGCVLEDDSQRLWINSNRGLIVVPRADLDEIADGSRTRARCRFVWTPECNGSDGLRDDDGRLWVPTVSGLAVVFPDKLSGSARGPDTVIESVRTRTRSLASEDGVFTTESGTDVEIDYTAITFVHAEDVEFRYRLEGLDPSWTEVGMRRTAVFTRLPPGFYGFRVQARNVDGLWGDVNSTVSLAIQPVWYQHRAFQILLGVLLGGLLFFLHRFRLAKVHERNEELQSQIRDRQVAEAAMLRSEKELRLSERRYRDVYETAPIAFVTFDLDARIVEWNDFAEETFGWRRKEAVGRDFLELVFPESDRPSKGDLIEDLRTGRFAEHETTRCSTKSGGTIICEWANSPLYDADGRVTGGVSLAIDVTERHDARRAVKDLRRRLMRAEESERGRIARELHDDLTQRVAAMAVEVGLMEQLRPGDEEEAAASLGQVRESLEQIAADVHSLSRRLHPTVLDDLGIVEAIRVECESRERLSHIRIDFEHDPMPQLPSDVSLTCFRVTQEALTNAARHASPDSALVVLRCDGDRVFLRIEDDGQGFESTGTNQGGLGLASMRERVELLGGTIAVSSEPGGGTVVEVEIPLVEDTLLHERPRTGGNGHQSLGR